MRRRNFLKRSLIAGAASLCSSHCSNWAFASPAPKRILSSGRNAISRARNCRSCNCRRPYHYSLQSGRNQPVVIPATREAEGVPQSGGGRPELVRS